MNDHFDVVMVFVFIGVVFVVVAAVAIQWWHSSNYQQQKVLLSHWLAATFRKSERYTANILVTVAMHRGTQKTPKVIVLCNHGVTS